MTLRTLKSSPFTLYQKESSASVDSEEATSNLITFLSRKLTDILRVNSSQREIS